jgi:hypothetical protein
MTYVPIAVAACLMARISACEVGSFCQCNARRASEESTTPARRHNNPKPKIRSACVYGPYRLQCVVVRLAHHAPVVHDHCANRNLRQSNREQEQ